MPAPTAKSDIIPTSIRFPPPLHKALKRLADKQGCPLTFKVIEILNAYITAYRAAHPEERL